ncbi:hypothetical protein [Chryseolinea lacunae]|uniref:Uncharacterized protein n=1 Tax=Chryseolinea lacunae TaxID=2801331 RepID=A0ABS1KVQ6_9BACT|nr:hypothetical protein [Chryseolinea lacunae]MBL0743449.1 hypothetical protein [Chryseolinea lacunae]
MFFDFLYMLVMVSMGVTTIAWINSPPTRESPWFVKAFYYTFGVLCVSAGIAVMFKNFIDG